MTRSLTFDGNEISGLGGVIISSINWGNIAERDSRMYKLARQDRSILTTSEFTKKSITVTGSITADSRAEGVFLWGVIATYCRNKNSEMIIDITNEVNTIYNKVTLESTDVTIKGGSVDFTLNFSCADPFGLSQGSFQLLQPNNITTTFASYSVLALGTVPALPVISVTCTSITGGTDKTVTIRSGENGQGISITRTWTSGDLIEIDSLNQTVRVNNGNVNFTGAYPIIDCANYVSDFSSDSIEWTDDFTARSVVISATYRQRTL